MSRITPFIALFAKGMAMGAADVVPGVSGGTIAFITGIYDRLLNALKNVPAGIKVLFSDGIKAAWTTMDATFLLCLFSGVLTSILSFAHLVSYLLATYPVMLWSFFFGLILVSGCHMLRQVDRWHAGTWGSLLFGVLFSYSVGILTPSAVTPDLGIFFFAGALAICAMILPGISGSFILLMLGLYSAVMEAVKNFDLTVMAVFACGCLAGLLSFSHLLSWLLKRYRAMTLSLLTGLMIGALHQVWPWKQTLQTRINSAGEEVPLLQGNLSPFSYESLTGQSAYMVESVALMFIAIALVLVLEKVGSKGKE